MDNGILKSVGDLKFIMNSIKDTMESTGLNLCGVYPTPNPFFMREGKLSTTLKFIVGQFFIMRNQKLMLNVRSESKEDYLNSILYYLNDGGVIRRNDLCVKSSKHARGGLGNLKTKRLQLNVRASGFLIEAFPEFVSHKKKIGEIRLK